MQRATNFPYILTIILSNKTITKNYWDLTKAKTAFFKFKNNYLSAEIMHEGLVLEYWEAR